MKTRDILLRCGCVLAVLSAYSQQRAQFSQYMVNNFVLNPAVAGTEDFVDIKAGFRYQWAGMEAAPVTYYVSGHTTIGKEIHPYGHHTGERQNWHGLGGHVYNDITGPTKRSGAGIAYSYNLHLSKHLRVSMGLSAGIQNFRVDGNGFILTHQTDDLLNGVHSTWVPDGVAGLWAYNKYFYAGMAWHQMISSKLEFSNTPDQEEGVLNDHYFFTAGGNLPMAEKIDLVPSFMAKGVKAVPSSVDLNVRMIYKSYSYHQHWFGLSHRVMDSFVAMIGTTITEYLEASYSFDLTGSGLRRFNYGSNEIVISYKANHKNRITCPSNFWK